MMCIKPKVVFSYGFVAELSCKDWTKWLSSHHWIFELNCQLSYWLALGVESYCKICSWNFLHILLGYPLDATRPSTQEHAPRRKMTGLAAPGALDCVCQDDLEMIHASYHPLSEWLDDHPPPWGSQTRLSRNKKLSFLEPKSRRNSLRNEPFFYRNIWSCLGMHQNCTKFGQEHGGKHRPWDMDMPQGSSLLFKSVQMLMFDIFLINRPINLHHCGDRTRAIAYLQCYCLSTLDVRFLRTDVWRCSNKTYSGFSCGRFQSYHMKWQTSLELKP